MNYKTHNEFPLDDLIIRVATYTGFKNARFIVQEWIYKSQATTLSAIKYVELSVNRFEVEKSRLRMRASEGVLVQDIYPLGFNKSHSVLIT